MSYIKNLYDLIVVGGGPAGLSTAIYMARAKYRVLVIEKEKIGGQITITSEIINYPGVKKTSGKELTDSMKQQAESFGASFVYEEVINMELETDIKHIRTNKGDYEALGVVLAVGANPRKLGFKGEKEFQGRGVAYCATCDGEFFTDMDVFVIGGGFAAVEEGIFLTRYAKSVNLIVREEDFTCAKTVADQIKKYDKISVKFHSEVVEVSGENKLEQVKFHDNITGEDWIHEAQKNGDFGVFVFAGYVPNTNWLPNIIELNQQGYIITDANQKTNLDGVYAAGDVCVKNLRQVVTAVSDGAIAATSLEKYVTELHDRLGIPELEVNITKLEKQNELREVSEMEKTSFASHEARFLSSEIREQLQGIVNRFESDIILLASLDNSKLSKEIKGFLEEFTSLTERVTWLEDNNETDNQNIIPSIEICNAEGKRSGIRFHAVPGGHEINSFVIALYNVAGPGQAIDKDIKEQLSKITERINIKIGVSLSCTMCPETVMSAQKVASIAENIEAEMFDLEHFPELKEKYSIMSVPCMIINDTKVVFGKKNVNEVTEIITKLIQLT